MLKQTFIWFSGLLVGIFVGMLIAYDELNRALSNFLGDPLTMPEEYFRATADITRLIGSIENTNMILATVVLIISAILLWYQKKI